MPDPISLALIAAVFLLSTCARTALGFGDALLAMPLLALFVPMTLAAPVVALASALNAFLILSQDWKSLQFRQAGWLIVIALSGIPLGAWLLNNGDDRVLKAILGFVVLGFSLWSLGTPTTPELKSGWWNLPFGLAAGFLGGAYNTAGPPLVIFASLKKWPPDTFRVILQAYFLPSGLLIVALHGWHGRMTESVFTVFAVILPAITIGYLAGRRVADRIPEDRFRKAIHIALLFPGALLLYGAFCR